MLTLALALALAPPTTPAPESTSTSTSASKSTAKAPFASVSTATWADLLTQHRGKVTLVNFWASYCVPCLKEIPALQALATEFAPKGVDVVFVSSDDPATADYVAGMLASKSIAIAGQPNSHIVSDTDPQPFIDMIKAQTAPLSPPPWGGEMPYTIVYGRDGAPLQVLPGAQTKEAFAAALTAAVSAQPQKASQKASKK